MEPMLPNPNNVPQSTPQAGEYTSGVGVEAGSMQQETAPAPPSVPTSQLPVVQPVQPPAVDDAQSTTLPQDDTTVQSPAIAEDVDVIEKEWVDKAKKIVSETKSDPRQQGRQVGQLQADYLMKRYGKEIKITE